MNKRLLTALSLTAATVCTPLAFADNNQSCEQYYQQGKSAFLQSLQNGDASAIHSNIQTCVQNNACANAKDPGTCVQRIHLYDYYATAAAKQQQQASGPFGNSLGASAPQAQPSQSEQKPKSSYNFTYKPPMQRPQNNGNNVSIYQNSQNGGQSNPVQQNMYKNINF